MNRDIILASKSETRIKLLRNAGITFEPVAHGIDEDEIKMSMSKNTPEEVVVKLAEMKALKPSMSNRSAYKKQMEKYRPVSYTHQTLPTNREV